MTEMSRMQIDLLREASGNFAHEQEAGHRRSRVLAAHQGIADAAAAKGLLRGLTQASEWGCLLSVDLTVSKPITVSQPPRPSRRCRTVGGPEVVGGLTFVQAVVVRGYASRRPLGVWLKPSCPKGTPPFPTTLYGSGAPDP